MNLRMQYARPRKLDQATELLDALGTGAMVIAGGQELMPYLNYGRISPSIFMDISGLAELEGIEETAQGISIGALTVHRQIQINPVINSALPLLSFAAAQIGGGRQVHNRGTIGGNIVAMHALYDIAPALIALRAQIEVAGNQGLRTVPLTELLVETDHDLGTKTLLTRIVIPAMDPASGWAYEKLKITEGSYGSANAAAIVLRKPDGDLQVDLVVGAVAEQPVDLTGPLSERLRDNPDTDLDEQIDAVCQAVIPDPISDQRGHAEYRKAMACVVAKRAVAAAIKKIKTS